MDDPKKLAVQAWLFKSKRDLDSSLRLADKTAPMLDTAIYHCQQAAEKAVKAFLVYCDFRPPKTHDLEVLITATAPYTSAYAALADAADRLTDYAVVFRYPGAQAEPTEPEYKQAYQDAADFLRVTLALIPAEAHPAA